MVRKKDKASLRIRQIKELIFFTSWEGEGVGQGFVILPPVESQMILNRLPKFFHGTMVRKLMMLKMMAVRGPTSFPEILGDLLREYGVTLDDIFSPQIGQSSSAPFLISEIRTVLKQMKNKEATGPSKISKYSILFLLKFIPNLVTAYINF